MLPKLSGDTGKTGKSGKLGQILQDLQEIAFGKLHFVERIVIVARCSNDNPSLSCLERERKYGVVPCPARDLQRSHVPSKVFNSVIIV